MNIGLVGTPRSGKDAISDFFVSRKGFKKIAFADKIKEEYYRVSGHSEEIFQSSKGTDLEEKIREGLWNYSNYKILEVDKFYFINPVINYILSNKSSVVSDVRTIDEFNELVKIGAKIVYVYRIPVVLKDDDFVQGTKICFKYLKDKPSFWNHYRDLDSAYRFLEVFYKEILLDGESQ